MYKEQWLYKCSMCGAAQFIGIDQGEIWYTECGGCNNLQFHHKIILAKSNNLYGEVKMFIQSEEEKEDVGSQSAEKER